MTSKRVYQLIIGLLVTSVLGVVTAIYLGNKLLFSQSRHLVDQKISNKVLENQELSLAKAKQNIQKYKNLEELTQAIVPRDKDQARATREILTLAQESGIQIKSITFPASNLGAATQKSTPKESEQSGSTPSPNPVSQAVPVKGLNGIYSLEATITPKGPVNYYQFIDFLAKLEKNRRTSQVTSIRIEPKSSSRQNPQLLFTLKLNMFLKP